MRQPIARAAAMIALSQYEKPLAALISNVPVRIKEMRHRLSVAAVYVVA
jgi:hypothetical protein